MPDNNETTIAKNKFSGLFLAVALILMMLPFISTFNEFLTAIFLKWQWYKFLEDIVVPYEARILAGLLNMMNFSAIANSRGIMLNGIFLEIQWNCLGWQSGLLLIASFLTGFQGKFSKSSRIEVIIIGVLGTFILNIVRMLIVSMFAVMFGRTAALVFHDWFSLIFVIIWFFVFWWFSYAHVLEEDFDE